MRTASSVHQPRHTGPTPVDEGTPTLNTPPPPILSGVPESFAHDVFHQRHPKLIARLEGAFPYHPEQRTALHALLAESTTGTVQPLPADSHDAPGWNSWGSEHYGKLWADVPFLWAESFFYRRLLEAVGYFGHSAWRGIDPFGPFKTAELHGATVTGQLHALEAFPDLPVEQRRDQLLLSSLWGNRSDLGFQLTATATESTDALLIDDSPTLWAILATVPAPSLHLIADNAGGELLPDLALIDHLLTHEITAHVTVWVKPHPYYVSDATMTDVLAILDLLTTAATPEANRLGDRLTRHMHTARLAVRTHEFFCAPLSFTHMPTSLASELGTATVTILKGDLNYRRLVGDLHWPAVTPFTTAASHFPSSALALRTLKSDVVVGLTDHQRRQLDTADPRWRTNGTRALVSAHQRTATPSASQGNTSTTTDVGPQLPR
ncbi:damage-control phosphatase ARMT1 family protein [Nocardia takedensis]|uniref:damage-control phosphatase ARMT1 family protein n=1 Tax=Nocardia takedensis TaxID=259390 RepID=UPI0007C4B45E|nr:damage-control phosphatase ARMT1 family protein [Nocardia takedensis]